MWLYSFAANKTLLGALEVSVLFFVFFGWFSLWNQVRYNWNWKEIDPNSVGDHYLWHTNHTTPFIPHWAVIRVLVGPDSHMKEGQSPSMWLIIWQTPIPGESKWAKHILSKFVFVLLLPYNIGLLFWYERMNFSIGNSHLIECFWQFLPSHLSTLTVTVFKFDLRTQ